MREVFLLEHQLIPGASSTTFGLFEDTFINQIFDVPHRGIMTAMREFSPLLSSQGSIKIGSQPL